MKSVLITGANKSIGFETTRKLLKKGYHVFLGSRDIKRGQDAVDRLVAEGLSEVEVVEIDVDNSDSVKSAREAVGKKTDVLDVLINNAGTSGRGPDDPQQTATGTDVSIFKKVYETNVFGVVRVTQAFIDLLKNSDEPRVVNLSSSQGSLAMAVDPSFKYYRAKGAAYQSSKSALNMYTINLAYEMRDTNFKVNAVDPGFTDTDFNYHRGTGTLEDAATRVVKYATIGADGPTGKFFSEETNPGTGEIAW